VASAMMKPDVLAKLAEIEQKQLTEKLSSASAPFAAPFAYAPLPTASAAASFSSSSSAAGAAGAAGAPILLGVGATSVPAPRSGVLIPSHAIQPGKLVGGGGAASAVASASAAASSMEEQILMNESKKVGVLSSVRDVVSGMDLGANVCVGVCVFAWQGNKQNLGAATPVSVLLAEEGVVQRNKKLKLQQKKLKRDKKKMAQFEAEEAQVPSSMAAAAGLSLGSGSAGAGGARTIQAAAAAAGMEDL
jgi:hypothetical protein